MSRNTIYLNGRTTHGGYGPIGTVDALGLAIMQGDFMLAYLLLESTVDCEWKLVDPNARWIPENTPDYSLESALRWLYIHKSYTVLKDMDPERFVYRILEFMWEAEKRLVWAGANEGAKAWRAMLDKKYPALPHIRYELAENPGRIPGWDRLHARVGLDYVVKDANTAVIAMIKERCARARAGA